MTLHINYITDAKGNKVSVVIPYEEWLEYQSTQKKIDKKEQVLKSIKNGLKEIAEAKKNNKKLQTLEEFLNEC